jgi:hypothetical protein
LRPYWNLAGDFSIHDAALLIAGCDPEDFIEVSASDVRRMVSGYTTTVTALSNAVDCDRLPNVARVYDDGDFGGHATINIHYTRVAVEDLDVFTRAAGIPCAAFQRGSGAAGGAPSGMYYSAKLFAANRAWEAVTANPGLLRGKSPKQALTDWLTQHAAELGLMNGKGQPNATGIEEIAKVANWKPEGGATPTPGPLPPSSSPRSGPREDFSADLDDEIPW